jgi:hypothetical protein
MMDMQVIRLDFYDGISNELLRNGMLYCAKYDDYVYFNYLGANWGGYYTDTISGISKIEIEFPLNSVLMGKPLKIELYLEGEGYSSSNLRSGVVGRSNVLTFFFDPLSTTSLNEVINDKNYTYKYFLLSGKESQTKPIGAPFVEMIYINGVLMGKVKYLIVK